MCMDFEDDEIIEEDVDLWCLEMNPDFKFEYAFESITEKNSLYKEILSNID